MRPVRADTRAPSNALADDNFEVAKLTLAQQGAIPADATVLVIAGPTTDLLPQEAELITRVPQERRQAAADDRSAGPDKAATAQPTSLIALAKSWGIQVGDDIVVDPSPSAGRSAPTRPCRSACRRSIQSRRTSAIMTAFPLARSVTPVEGGTDGKFAQTFVQTGEQSWAETDVKGLYATGQPEKNVDKGDKAGPISVAAAVSAPAAAARRRRRPRPATARAGRAESRIAAGRDRRQRLRGQRWLSACAATAICS